MLVVVRCVHTICLLIYNWFIHSSLWTAIRHSLSFFTLARVLVHLFAFDKASKNANFFIPVCFKVKTILLTKPKLKKVIIQTFLRYSYFFSCIFKRPSLKLQLLRVLRVRHHHTVVELSPRAHLFDDVRNGSLLRPCVPRIFGSATSTYGRAVVFLVSRWSCNCFGIRHCLTVSGVHAACLSRGYSLAFLCFIMEFIVIVFFAVDWLVIRTFVLFRFVGYSSIGLFGLIFKGFDVIIVDLWIKFGLLL